MTRFIAIVSARHRGWIDGRPIAEQVASPDDYQWIEALITDAILRFARKSVVIIGMSSDAGFGRSVRELAAAHGVGFVDVITRVERLDSVQREYALLSRHTAIMDLAHEIYVFRSSHATHIEDLVAKLKMSEEWDVIENQAQNAIAATARISA